MGAKIGAVWHARANNPYYRVRELTLPAMMSTGPQRFAFATTFLPHVGGTLLLKREGHEHTLNVIADQPIRFESGTENEIANMTDQELRFTVTELK